MDVFYLGLLIGAVAAFFVGVAIVVVNIATASFGRARVSRSLSAIDNVYGMGRPGTDDGSGDRAPSLAANRMGKLGRAATSGGSLARLRRWLDQAGNPPYWTVDRLFELKGLGLIVFSVLGTIVGLAIWRGVWGTLGALVGAAFGYFLPDIVVYELADRRQQKVRRTLPDTLDTLTVSVEAGLGFDAALAQVTRYGRGPLAGEFARVLQEMQIGRSRVDALRALAQRTNVTELKSFCAIVVQATELGVPIANVMREQSREMRIRRRQHAEELAQKIPVKILFPLIFCLFPALFIVVLGPGMIRILDTFDLL
jgi:tight adherence protein C